MLTIDLVLMLFAVLLLGAAAVGVTSSRVNLGWLGLTCWALTLLL